MSDSSAQTLSPLERAFGAIVKTLTTFVSGGSKQPRYHPARHYMRGPGPKWRAVHLAQASRSAAGHDH